MTVCFIISSVLFANIKSDAHQIDLLQDFAKEEIKKCESMNTISGKQISHSVHLSPNKYTDMKPLWWILLCLSG